MNLAEANALSVLAKAGRKAITEKSRIVAHPELHKVLKYQGFHVQSTKPGQSSYIHPKTGAKATVKDDGNWNVTYPKPKELQPKIRPGKKVVTKAKPTAKATAKPSLKMKVAAGGPGSGPHPGFGRAVMSIQPEHLAKLMEKLHPHITKTHEKRLAEYTNPNTPFRDETHGFTAGGPGSGRHKSKQDDDDFAPFTPMFSEDGFEWYDDRGGKHSGYNSEKETKKDIRLYKKYGSGATKKG